MNHHLVRSRGFAHQLYLPFLLLLAFVVATSLPASAAQGNEGASNSTVSLPEHGVTMQVSAGWSHHQYANVHELLNVPEAQIGKLSPEDRDNAAKIRVNALQNRNHSKAVERLGQVAAEYKTPPTFLTIDGWPALQRQTLVPKPERGQEENSAKLSDEPRKMLVLVTTAVAVGNAVFRLDGTVSAESPAAQLIAEQMKEIGRQLRFHEVGNPAAAAQEVQELQNKPATVPAAPRSLRTSVLASPTALQQTGSQQPGIAFFNTQLGGEPEIAVSTSGQNIAIAAQCNGTSSQDGGQTFSATFGFPNCTGGDSSLAYGRSGNFYEGTIGTVNKSQDAQVVNVSTNGGKTFQFRSNPFVCGTCAFVNTNNPNGVPDQEHIAADRFNAGPAPTAGDQVYFVWRKPSGYGISCSSDSGNNWTAAQFFGDGAADFPRITVGEDGLVYVAYLNGGNIEVDRYTSCANGLNQQKQGLVAAAGTNAVDCPIAGLDRCGGNGGTGQNDLRSHTIAVDDTNASHLYVAYAANTVSAVNEDVFVVDSYDNGQTWSAPTRVNNSIPGRRFMPWVCSVGGAAYVSWYDRRSATAITNDATDYFAGSAAPSGGILTAGSDFQINAPTTGDPQCASGWPASPAAASYSESCFVQPQLAGQCGTANPLKTGDTGTRCDFSGPDATACGTGPNGAESCQAGRGSPKYGDYNGNACAAGRLYTIWASATSQPGANQPANGINLFFSQKLVCCSPQIQVPGPVSINACSGTTTTSTVNLCNTGKADLQINSISSSNSKIIVTTPTSGYPLIVSPDSCFPAQITLSPGITTGTVSGTLTIASNDTVNPSATVQVNGSSPAPSINATIVNSGNFGNVCPGGQSSLNLNVTNQSSCDLKINSITTSANFLPPTTVSLPLILTADATVAVPISFAPSVSQTCSNTNAITGTVTLNSNDPTQGGGNTVVNLSGLVPCPSINATIVNKGAFGNVCAGTQADLNLQVLNTGQCNLNISSVASNDVNFVLPSGTAYPLVLSADANVNLPIRFQPAPYGSAGYRTCSNVSPQTAGITIASNDPIFSSLVTAVQGIEGCPTLVLSPQKLNGIDAFPATVSDPTQTLGCFTDKQITVSNAGICPLIIPTGGLSATPSTYFSVVNPTTPLALAPGAGSVPISVRFRPLALTGQNAFAPDQQTGSLLITSNDPVTTDDTAGAADGLCGEPVYHSGARVLVVDTFSNPVSSVAKMTLVSKGLTPPFSQTLMPALLRSGSACGKPILYHLDNETLRPAGTTGNNPRASYVLSAKNGSTQANMSFTLGQCQMQQIILQVK